jgi:hypothetical protein
MNREEMDLIRRDLRQLTEERRRWETHWRELCDYILPHRGRFPDQGRGPDDGASRMDQVVDSTAYRARRILASGLQSGLTSPSRPWFKLGLAEQDLARRQEVKAWLSQVEERMREALSQSNFYNAIHALYEELSAFGTGVLHAEAGGDPTSAAGAATGAAAKTRTAPPAWRGLRFQALTVGEYYLSVNMDGDIDTLYRRFTMPARAMAQRFGDKALSEPARRALDQNPYKHLEVVHLVRPRKSGARTLLPYESVHFEYAGGEGLLAESGYAEFPYMVARWDVSGWDSYGRGPGMVALPDVKMLQELARDRLKAVKKAVDPPLTMPATLKDRVKTFPGGLNYVDAASHPAARPLYQIAPDMGSLSVSIEDTRAAIRDGFFNDLFLMLASSRSSQPVTAREIAERHEEKLLVLGPVIERLHSELLSPLIDRVFGLLLSSGRLPAPPRELSGRTLKTEYISTLSQAQKMVGTQSIEAMAAFVGQMAGLSPEAMDKIDLDRVVDRYADLIGAPGEIIRSEEEVARLRQARDQARSQAGRQQAALALARGARDLAQAPTDGQSALTALLGATPGGNA